MTTGVPRLYHTQQLHFLRKTVGFADNGVAKLVGTIPAGSLIMKALSGVFVSTVFNAGTTNTLNIGIVDSATTDDDYLATLLAIGALAFVALDEAVGGFLVTKDTDITATVVLTGTAATTGSAEVVINYVPDIDG